jgi:hypothetical protein
MVSSETDIIFSMTNALKEKNHILLQTTIQEIISLSLKLTQRL